MLDDIQIGPFTYSGGKPLTVNSTSARRWTMSYGDKLLFEKVRASSDTAGITQSELLAFFEEERANFVLAATGANTPSRIQLIDFETGDAVGSFFSNDMCGMTTGLINDSSRYWIRSLDKRYSRDVTIDSYAQIVAQHKAPARAWIADLLPDEVMTQDAEQWRAPTSWELRHVVGEGSFTGVTGAKAAELVGVTPQNFRKYTAKDGASSRQNISFSMWHLLLHKLGVQKA